MQDADAPHSVVEDHIVVQDQCNERDAELDSWIPASTDAIQIRRHGVGQVWQGTLARLLYLEQVDTWRQHQRDHLELWVPKVPKGPVSEDVQTR